MAKLDLQFAEGKTAFRPAETITGVVTWDLEQRAEAIDIRLGWRTRGKGGVDQEVVDRKRLENPEAKGEQAFEFTAPVLPISFSGKIVAVVWSVSVVVMPAGAEAQRVITISPTGVEVDLYALP